MEQVKIINSNNQKDIDFILKGDYKLKESFENINNEWNKYMIESGQKIRVRSPNLIEKYNNQIELIDNKYFSSKMIYYTSSEIFEKFNNSKFSILIIDNEIKALAIGSIWPDCLYISHVRSNIKGGCTKVIDKLINSWWDNDKLKFISYESNNDPFLMLHVLPHNESGIGCYKKFGFRLTDEILRGEQVMILTKEVYVEKYLLPLTEKKLNEKNIFNF
jgi:hypothetical protein